MIIKNISSIIFFIILIFILLPRIPKLIYYRDLEGTKIEHKLRRNLMNDAEVVFPPKDGPSMAIYWASWCQPCKIEMNRLANSVRENKIPSSKIFAINLFEDELTIKKFIQKSQYPFIFLKNDLQDELFKITATPTTIIFNKDEISSISQGMSIIGIWKAELQF